jgi:erythromycin esterase-like protein
MTCVALLIALLVSTSAFGALPGVVELKKGAPEQVTDAELSKLIGARVSAADVIALGETVHGSSSLLRLQARVIRYLVTNHGFRLIAW